MIAFPPIQSHFLQHLILGSMAESSQDRNQHVAVLAFSYATHAAPLLNLVAKLARSAPHVTFSFFTTQQCQHALFSCKPAGTIPENIRSYVVSDGIADGSSPLRHDNLLDLFLEAGPENLQEGLRVAVSETNARVSCVISDAFVTSGFVIAEQLGVSWIALWASYPFVLSVHFYTDLIRQKCGGDHDDGRRLGFIPGLSSMQVQDLPPMIKWKEEEGESAFNKMLGSTGRMLPRAKAVVINFYQELDRPELVHNLRSKMANVIYAGFLNFPLSPSKPSPSTTDKTGSLSWLDQQSAKSVVYISLGTVVAPPAYELVAIAESFLWSLAEEYSKALLPNGFIKKSSTRGKVVTWAPQTLVLGHESVGVFVTHCGCNSVSECFLWGSYDLQATFWRPDYCCEDSGGFLGGWYEDRRWVLHEECSDEKLEPCFGSERRPGDEGDGSSNEGDCASSCSAEQENCSRV